MQWDNIYMTLNLVWTQVSTLLKYNCSVGETFKITGIWSFIALDLLCSVDMQGEENLNHRIF